MKCNYSKFCVDLAVEGKMKCPAHLEKIATLSREWARKNRETVNIKSRENFARLKEEKRCVLCGSPAAEGLLKCRECQDKVNSKQKEFREENKEFVNQQALGYYHEKKDLPGRKERKREVDWFSHLKRNRGLTQEQVLEMLEAQNFCCAICDEPNNLDQKLHLDHDHATGKVRAFLCQRCNTTLGFVKESAELLDKMKEYIKYYE